LSKISGIPEILPGGNSGIEYAVKGYRFVKELSDCLAGKRILQYSIVNMASPKKDMHIIN